jgi:alpha-D-glucose phosphate-specific phosphoglucomutase
MDIKFGTDGWRGIIADNFTFENVKIAAQAIADYYNKTYRNPSLIVGYDTRFLSKEFADTVSRILSANNIKVYITNKATPTPAVSYGILLKRTNGAVVLTASHNPPDYCGIKIKGDYAGAAFPEITKSIEENLFKNEVKTNAKPELVETIDIKQDYLKKISSYVDIKKILKSKFKVVVEPMYGVTAGYLNDIFKTSKLKVTYLHQNQDPLFNGIRPEPLKHNLLELIKTVKKTKADIGLATDGDGDRIGLVADNGDFLDAQKIIPLFMLHLIRNRGLTGKAVRTNATTILVEKIAKKYNLEVFETPIGFKYVTELMLKDDILIGGEESGGVGYKEYIPERDGLLGGLIALELLAITGKKISKLVSEMEKEFGKFEYARRDFSIPLTERERVVSFVNEFRPDNILNIPVARITTFDGVKYILKDESWVLVRASGTEPILRVYSEASTLKKANSIIEFIIQKIKI